MTCPRLLAGFCFATALTVLIGLDGPVLQAAPQDTPKQGAGKRQRFPKKPDASLATGSNGSVSDAAAQELVKPTGKPLDYRSLAAAIDREVDKQLAAAKLTPSPRTDDAEFIRRASLDITGVIPSPERVREFLDSPDPLKRSKLIDQLLASPNFGRHQSDLWMNVLYPVGDSENRFVNQEPLAKWLAVGFNTNRPWDKMAYELLTATGEQDEHPAVTYFMANRGVDRITDSVSRAFLGVQLQCAQCHNHPFTTWKQTDYWGMAQFFMKVNAVVQRNGKKQVNAGVTETERVNRGMNPLPESAKQVPARVLGGKEVHLSSGPARPALARWVTQPGNPYFARSMVNRVWSELFGRGLVNPVDDMLPENEPTHPELLSTLAREFTLSGFDVKHLIRSICSSQAYQRSSKPLAGNRDDHTLVSHQAVKALTPEQLFDSLSGIIGMATQPPRPMGNGAMAQRGPARSPREQFALFFRPGESARPTDYDAGIPQALRLMNSPRLSTAPGLVKELARGSGRAGEVVEKLYLMTVSRRPTAAEVGKLTGYVARQPDPATAYADILWALLNSSEFALNR